MCEWHLLSLKLTETFLREKILPKNEAFDSQDTAKRLLIAKIAKQCNCLDTLLIIKLSNMKHQSRLKVLQKLYIINNVIFRPHWLKPFSN